MLKKPEPACTTSLKPITMFSYACTEAPEAGLGVSKTGPSYSLAQPIWISSFVLPKVSFTAIAGMTTSNCFGTVPGLKDVPGR
jgi:hypothetical protein